MELNTTMWDFKEISNLLCIQSVLKFWYSVPFIFNNNALIENT